ncbi:GNAT family N-acetyltransferase [Chitinimonas koreensis]|uniref:GNAT family N-acetyltransferase n=1 Tax=Chitinimonas koreensis TaxID=356302 RepID=UPI0003FCE854|nr:GNAT family N-acetyltransferase [Chitinimonas koreensis]QNM98555.1 GNAT family N-acetyltransferase [Chitinimonas koreensis]
MLIDLELADALAAAELLALQRLAYRQEAELIGYPRLPPLLESLPELMDCGETVIGWREDGELLGALGYVTEGDALDVCRLVVAPAAQRRGIARQLVQAAIDAAGGRPVGVSTAAANAPALALYRTLGFAVTREFATADGLALVSLARPPR